MLTYCVYVCNRVTDLEHSMEETLSTRLQDVLTPQYAFVSNVLYTVDKGLQTEASCI